jgi:hypothetical protein
MVNETDDGLYAGGSHIVYLAIAPLPEGIYLMPLPQ